MAPGIVDLRDSRRAAELCGLALDLPEDAAEGASLVERLCRPPAGRQTVRLASEDGAGVLFASINDADAAIGNVELVTVHPESRLRGTGRALLAAAEARLAGLGATSVRLGETRRATRGRASTFATRPPCAWPGDSGTSWSRRPGT